MFSSAPRSPATVSAWRSLSSARALCFPSNANALHLNSHSVLICFSGSDLCGSESVQVWPCLGTAPTSRGISRRSGARNVSHTEGAPSLAGRWCEPTDLHPKPGLTGAESGRNKKTHSCGRVGPWKDAVSHDQDEQTLFPSPRNRVRMSPDELGFSQWMAPCELATLPFTSWNPVRGLCAQPHQLLIQSRGSVSPQVMAEEA